MRDAIETLMRLINVGSTPRRRVRIARRAFAKNLRPYDPRLATELRRSSKLRR